MQRLPLPDNNARQHDRIVDRAAAWRRDEDLKTVRHRPLEDDDSLSTCIAYLSFPSRTTNRTLTLLRPPLPTQTNVFHSVSTGSYPSKTTSGPPTTMPSATVGTNKTLLRTIPETHVVLHRSSIRRLRRMASVTRTQATTTTTNATQQKRTPSRMTHQTARVSQAVPSGVGAWQKEHPTQRESSVLVQSAMSGGGRMPRPSSRGQ